MDKIRFWKMHELGNDYVIIDNRDEVIKKGLDTSARKSGDT